MSERSGRAAGMTRVMAAGVFDLIHLGHVHYLTEAAKLGDELHVVVSSDAMVRRRKHEPINAQDVRLAVVAALKPVAHAIIGDEADQMRSVDEIRPDVIALGHDDYHRVEELKRQLAERGHGHVRVERMPRFEQDLAGTRRIVQRILALYDAHGVQKP